MAIQQNAVNVPITITVTQSDGTTPLSLIGATVKKLILRAPAGAVTEVDAVFPQGSNGSDGKLQYVWPLADPEGTWQVQAQVAVGSINTPTAVGLFDVEKSL